LPVLRVLGGSGLLVLLPELRSVLPERDGLPRGVGAGTGLLSHLEHGTRTDRAAVARIPSAAAAALGVSPVMPLVIFGRQRRHRGPRAFLGAGAPPDAPCACRPPDRGGS